MSSDEESTGSYESHDEDSGSEEEPSPPPKPVPKKRGKPKKDPNKPKRNMSAFFLYSNANRPRVKAENEGIAFGQVAKVLSVEYKALPANERTKWDKKAGKDKERYLREMEDYVAPSDDDDSDGPKKKKKAKKDPNAPKRNMSAFFLYSGQNRPRVREENPEATFGSIAKIISVEFKAISAAERARYDELAVQDKVRYQREMAVYQG